MLFFEPGIPQYLYLAATMIRCYLFFATVFLSSSCATLIHHRTVAVDIYSDTDSVKICVNNDTIKWYNTPASIRTKRSPNSLNIIAEKDSTQQQINVKSELSNAFWIGNLVSGMGFLGYAVDLTNPQRFTYPATITINFKSNSFSTNNYRAWQPPEKGFLAFKISIPEGNHFYLNKGKGYGNTFGFLGISGGIEYYFSDKYCINTDFGALTNFAAPLPVPFCYDDNYQRAYAVYGDIQLGTDYKRFHYDFGVQYTRTSYYEREVVELSQGNTITLEYSKNQSNMGLALSSYYRILNGFNLGLNYYPSFAVWDNTGFSLHYTHLLFFEFGISIAVIRLKRNK